MSTLQTPTPKLQSFLHGIYSPSRQSQAKELGIRPGLLLPQQLSGEVKMTSARTSFLSTPVVQPDSVLHPVPGSFNSD